MRKEGTSPSVDEFIGSISDFSSLPTSIQTDLLAYYLVRVLGRANVSARELEELRRSAHLSPHANLAVYLSTWTRPGKGKYPKFVRAPKGYTVERAYRGVLEAEHLGRPTAKTIARDLRAELKKITDADVASYLEEAVSCFEYGLFRGAIVLTWCVAYSRLRDWIFNNHLAAFNAVTGAWKNPVALQKLDDFQELQEGTVLETARKASLLSKELHKTLKQLLDQRNSYAHPSHKPVRSSIAEAYIETTFQEVLPKLT